TYLAHDLAARPAGKFQFIALLPNLISKSGTIHIQQTNPQFCRKIFLADSQLVYIPFIFASHNPAIVEPYEVPEEESLWQKRPILRKQ
ncbi:MAG: hypothetical protein ACI4P4_11255, partial [Faecousia sp.]